MSHKGRKPKINMFDDRNSIMRYTIGNKICTKGEKSARNMREYKAAKKKNLVLAIENEKEQEYTEAEL